LTEKVVSFRIDEKLNGEIEKESKLEGLDKSEVFRRLIQEAISRRKIDRAIIAYLKGDLGFSAAAIEANLSIWDFFNELNQSKTQLNFNLEQFLKEVELSTELISKIIETKIE
jgi:hypothetical protein